MGPPTAKFVRKAVRVIGGGRHADALGEEGMIAEVVGRLVRQFDPDRILLFGSRARGDARPDSDVDLLVVLPHMENKHQTLVAMLRAVADLPIAIDILPTDRNEIASRGHVVGTVLRSALREGKVLYERGG